MIMFAQVVRFSIIEIRFWSQFHLFLTVGEPFQSTIAASGPNTILQELSPSDKDYQSVAEEMQSTIVEHKDGGVAGGIFTK